MYHEEKKTKSHIAGIVALYFLVSISLVFINKSLLSSDNSLKAPLFITWFQCVVTVLILYALGNLGSNPNIRSDFLRQFPQYTYDFETGKNTLRLAMVFVGMITFNNLCLQHVEVSFYNVARSLTIVFNVVFTYFFLNTRTSMRTCATLIIVILGFILGTDGEVNFSLIGTLFGVTSSIFVSLNSIATKWTLPYVENDTYKLAAYSNTNAMFLFIPLIVMSGELDVLRENTHLLFSPSFWFTMTLSGFFGFAIGIVTVLQIRATSPLTHNISGTAKACVQTILALMYYGNATTLNNLMGIAFVLFGSLLYSYVRTMEMNSAPKLGGK